jgi:hypothetical protein
MVDETERSDDTTADIRAAALPAPATPLRPRAGEAGGPARSAPKRLSKSQRKHVRRLKQAGQWRVPPRR